MAQSAGIMTRWARLLESVSTLSSGIDFATEAAWWQSIEDEFTVKTRLMWQNGWFRDYDSASKEWSSQQDVMHLAPIFCGAAEWGHTQQLSQYFSQPPMHSSGWAPLSWPPVVLTLIGAAAAARKPSEAAELSYHFIDAAYRSVDNREPDEHGGLPGVTREYHAALANGKREEFEYVNAGIEAYGWGALSIHLLIRYVLGLQEQGVDKITIAPMLPHTLRRVGAIYRIEPIPWGKYVLSIECVVRDAQGYIVRLRCTQREREEAMEAAEAIDLRQPPVVQEREWEGTWGEERALLLPQLIDIR